MALVDTYELLETHNLPARSLPESLAPVIPLPVRPIVPEQQEKKLNLELITEQYDGHTVYILGTTALKTNHWLEISRFGLYHLAVSDIQKKNVSGPYWVAVESQLKQACRLFAANPGFTETLYEDIEQAGSECVYDDGRGRRVADYLHVISGAWGCRRLTIHPDPTNEHVAPKTREHTIEVVRTVVNI